MNRAEKWVKRMKDEGKERWDVMLALEKKFPQCKRIYADVEPKPFPPEYINAVDEFYPLVVENEDGSASFTKNARLVGMGF